MKTFIIQFGKSIIAFAKDLSKFFKELLISMKNFGIALKQGISDFFASIAKLFYRRVD